MPCNCGPKHLVRHPGGAITSHSSEAEARAVADSVGGEYLGTGS